MSNVHGQLLVALCGGVATLAAQDNAPVEWHTQLDKAVAQAREHKKPVFVYVLDKV